MSDADALVAAEQRRLTWRCRRGMLELDIILQRFVETSFTSLSLDELKVFDGLLNLPDGEFWAIVQSQTHQDPRVRQVVAMINQTGVRRKAEET